MKLRSESRATSLPSSMLGMLALLALFLLVSCGKTERRSPQQVTLDRGIPGIELGMTHEQVGESFKVEDRTDPVASVFRELELGELGMNMADEIVAVNKTAGKRFAKILPRKMPFPPGVESIGARFVKDVLYQIEVHCSKAYVERARRQGITLPYLPKYGKPQVVKGNSSVWHDGRTKIEIVLSGDTVNVFYTDRAWKLALEDYEVKAKQERAK